MSTVNTDSYLSKVTVCKYLNLCEGTQGATEQGYEIGGARVYFIRPLAEHSSQRTGRCCRQTHHGFPPGQSNPFCKDQK